MILVSLAVAAIAAAVVVGGTGGGGGPGRGGRHVSRRPAAIPTGVSAPVVVPSTPLGQPAAAPPPVVTLSRVVGQMIVGRFQGSAPSDRFLARVQAGQIGGVILFSENTAGGVAAVARTDHILQRAAHRGDNPPLLIMTDQEGGAVKRLVGPPSLAPSEMRSASVAQWQGESTGRLLRRAGVNVDLAPVADVPGRSGASFLGNRAFGDRSEYVAQQACAFAQGVASAGVVFTLKHFPGLGLAKISTDDGPVAIGAPAVLLREDYEPYLQCGSSPLALVMIDSASYPTLSGSLPAVISPAIYQQELRIAVQGTPVTISDDLEASALAGLYDAGGRAIAAGLDLAMYATSEAGSERAYRRLLQDARTGRLGITRLSRVSAQIKGLKSEIP